MTITDIPVPEIYKESADFRFFMKWIEMCFQELQYKTDNLIDLLDPLRCPSELLWMLGDTCGFKYDERVSVAFNRLIILYFANLIRNRGSKTGMVLAAEINLAQFSLLQYAKENSALDDRLEDTSIPVNSVSVTPHTQLGYIDLVYFSENLPVDSCIEYVRPVGMYVFSHAGAVVSASTKISVDARLTNLNDGGVRPGPAFVAHYRREDYARLQNYLDPNHKELTPRRPVNYRNMDYEKQPVSKAFIDPGYRSLFSLQLCNNEHILKALLPSLEEPDRIFDIGYGPQNVSTRYPDNYLKNGEDPMYNLRINKSLEESFTPQVWTVDKAKSVMSPQPAVNPVMSKLGDAISLNKANSKYTKVDPETGEIIVVRVREDEL